ncbi:MAG: hypothetical protein GVY29_04775 [Spirochaetes bacterium]|jgi:PII-like signaling protein|nr:hypothetical protein [Spirochaetota bacterium]
MEQSFEDKALMRIFLGENDHLQGLVPYLDEVVSEGMVTLEKVRCRSYRR